jgi:hypothetical protein
MRSLKKKSPRPGATGHEGLEVTKHQSENTPFPSEIQPSSDPADQVIPTIVARHFFGLVPAGEVTP